MRLDWFCKESQNEAQQTQSKQSSMWITTKRLTGAFVYTPQNEHKILFLYYYGINKMWVEYF